MSTSFSTGGPGQGARIAWMRKAQGSSFLPTGTFRSRRPSQKKSDRRRKRRRQTRKKPRKKPAFAALRHLGQASRGHRSATRWTACLTIWVRAARGNIVPAISAQRRPPPRRSLPIRQGPPARWTPPPPPVRRGVLRPPPGGGCDTHTAARR